MPLHPLFEFCLREINICCLVDLSRQQSDLCHYWRKQTHASSRLFGGGVRAHFLNSGWQYGLLIRVWFALRKIWFMSSDHWRLSVMVMPKSMVSLAVVSRVPSMWYSLFDSDFLLKMFSDFGMPKLIAKVWLQLESWVVLLNRDLIRSLRNDLV